MISLVKKTRASHTRKNNPGMDYMDYIKLTGAAVSMVGIVFLGWKGYKAVQRWKENRQGTKDYSRELNSRNVTLADSEISNMVAGIVSALNARWNDDEEAVYRELDKLKTPDDWKKLVIRFGVREKRNFTSANIKGGLKEWIVDAFSDKEQQKVSDILSKIGVVF